ncbi:MAG: flagellar motor protein MotB, partial [Gammaproteobacteria bacterium]|nr:flagellar motor protein MotB [Gammaproteobacteria bacterium]
MSEGPPAKKCPAGSPAWVMTFADLMSLLMCFFVLLLSFSEMDRLKFKQLAGSMEKAFGVQREIEVKTVPKGTSIIAREFSPGKPQPTMIKVLKQHTVDDTKDNLDVYDSEIKDKGDIEEEGQSKDNEGTEEGDVAKAEINEQNVTIIKETLQKEIEAGLLEIETLGPQTIIRIQEKGSFTSGSADLTASFEPVINKISNVLTSTTGRILVAGHTDNIPISTARYRSNWELSSSRSVTVMHKLLNYNDFNESRFLIEGYADSQPLAPN